MRLEPPDHTALWTPGAPVDAETREMHRGTVGLMLKALADVGAAGLSGSQIGLGLRFFVSANIAFQVAFNPAYESTGVGGFISKPERCLSRLDFTTFVRRPATVRATFEDFDGKPHELVLEGNDSRVFQHMTDLCDGKPIYPRPKAAVPV